MSSRAIIVRSLGVLIALMPGTGYGQESLSDDAFEHALQAPHSRPSAPERKVSPTPALPSMRGTIGTPGAGPAPRRVLDPLAGLGRMRPTDVVDAAAACADAVTPSGVDVSALHRLGWERVVGSAGAFPDTYSFAKPSASLEIMVPRSGENRKTCLSVAVIGSASEKALFERLMAQRFGPATPAPRRFMSAQSQAFRTSSAEILADAGEVARGVYRAAILVQPLGNAR